MEGAKVDFQGLVQVASAVEAKDRDTTVGKAFTAAILAKMTRLQIEGLKARLLAQQGFTR